MEIWLVKSHCELCFTTMLHVITADGSQRPLEELTAVATSWGKEISVDACTIHQQWTALQWPSALINQISPAKDSRLWFNYPLVKLPQTSCCPGHRRTIVTQTNHCDTEEPLWHTRTIVTQTNHCDTHEPLWHRWTTVTQTNHCDTHEPLWHRRTIVTHTNHCDTDEPLWHRRTIVTHMNHCDGDIPFTCQCVQ